MKTQREKCEKLRKKNVKNCSEEKIKKIKN
jgi:hypothetical protein